MGTGLECGLMWIDCRVEKQMRGATAGGDWECRWRDAVTRTTGPGRWMTRPDHKIAVGKAVLLQCVLIAGGRGAGRRNRRCGLCCYALLARGGGGAQTSCTNSAQRAVGQAFCSHFTEFPKYGGPQAPTRAAWDASTRCDPH